MLLSGGGYQHGISNGGSCVFCGTDTDKPTRCAVPQPDRRCIPHSPAKVPVSGQLLYDRLVSKEVCNAKARVLRGNSHHGQVTTTYLSNLERIVKRCVLACRFAAWPQEALNSVAHHFLDAVDLSEATKTGVVDVCVDMQQRVRDLTVRYRSEAGRFYYITPTSYLELINTFKVTMFS